MPRTPTVGRRSLALVLALVMLACLAGGCGWLWPRDNPMDPVRCDPSCPKGLVCVDGICKLGDGGWPFDGWPSDASVQPDSAAVQPDSAAVQPDSAAVQPDQAPVTPDLPAPDHTVPDLPPAAE